MDEPRPSLVRSGGAAGAVGRLSSPSWLLLLVPAAAAVGMLACEHMCVCVCACMWPCGYWSTKKTHTPNESIVWWEIQADTVHQATNSQPPLIVPTPMHTQGATAAVGTQGTRGSGGGGGCSWWRRRSSTGP